MQTLGECKNRKQNRELSRQNEKMTIKHRANSETKGNANYFGRPRGGEGESKQCQEKSAHTKVTQLGDGLMES